MWAFRPRGVATGPLFGDEAKEQLPGLPLGELEILPGQNEGVARQGNEGRRQRPLVVELQPNFGSRLPDL